MDQKDTILLSVIIISYNSVAYMEDCLRSCLMAIDASPLARGRSEIIVVENGSTESSAILIRDKFPSVLLHCLPSNKGYAAAVNFGASLARGECLLICNSDISFKVDSIDHLVGFMMSHPVVAASGPQLLFPSGAWQRSYGYAPGLLSTLANFFFVGTFEFLMLSTLYRLGIRDRAKKVGYIDGAVMLVRSDVFGLLGGFDERFFFYGEDVDFCVRVRRAGYEVRLNPTSEVFHVRGGSSVARTPAVFIEQRIKSQHILMKKHCLAAVVMMWLCLSRINASIRLIVFEILRLFAMMIGNRNLEDLANSRIVIWRAAINTIREMQ